MLTPQERETALRKELLRLTAEMRSTLGREVMAQQRVLRAEAEHREAAKALTDTKAAVAKVRAQFKDGYTWDDRRGRVIAYGVVPAA